MSSRPRADTSSSMSYDAIAEYHEVHMPAAWDRLRDVVSDTFGDVASDGVLVDIGAGSGIGTATLADTTDAEIIALEPNPTMRAMMVARLDNAGVLERVTVLPGSVPDGLHRVPERVDGVLAAHMLGHLTSEERTWLLDWIATSLAPGRFALLTVSAEAPAEAEGTTEPVVQERAVGRYVYRVTHHSPGPGRYEGRFEVIDDEQRVVCSLPSATHWESVTAAEIRTRLVGRTVGVTEPQAGVVMISRNR